MQPQASATQPLGSDLILSRRVRRPRRRICSSTRFSATRAASRSPRPRFRHFTRWVWRTHWASGRTTPSASSSMRTWPPGQMYPTPTPARVPLTCRSWSSMSSGRSSPGRPRRRRRPGSRGSNGRLLCSSGRARTIGREWTGSTTLAINNLRPLLICCNKRVSSKVCRTLRRECGQNKLFSTLNILPLEGL